MIRRRPLIYALLALAIPLPAFALDGGGAPPSGPAALSVSASLGECGLAETSIVCRIDANWDGIDGADYYTVSVSRADGSVVDYGSVGAGGTSLWVPYVGSGAYTVEVTAWGTPPGEDNVKAIAKDEATPDPSGDGDSSAPEPGPAPHHGHGAGNAGANDFGATPGPSGAGPSPPACEPTAEPDPADPTDPADPADPGTPPLPPPPPPADPGAPGASAASVDGGELPQSVSCP